MTRRSFTRRDALVLAAGAFGLGVTAIAASRLASPDDPQPTNVPHATPDDLDEVPHGGVRSYLADVLGVAGAGLATASDGNPADLEDTRWIGHVKYTCFDGRVTGDIGDMDFNELFASGLGAEAFLIQYESMCTFYWPGEGDRVYAVVDTTPFNAATMHVTYGCVMRYHNLAEPVEGATFDVTTGVASVPIEAFEGYEDPARQIQIQLLCISEASAPRANIPVTIVAEPDIEHVLTGTSTVSTSNYDQVIRIPVIDPSVADTFSQADFEVRLDGMDLPMLCDEGSTLATYDPASGEIWLGLHAASLPAIEVWVRSRTAPAASASGFALGVRTALADIPTPHYHDPESMNLYPYGCVVWDRSMEALCDSLDRVGTRIAYKGAAIDIATDTYNADGTKNIDVMNEVYDPAWYEAPPPSGGAMQRIRWYMGHFFNELSEAAYCVPFSGADNLAQVHAEEFKHGTKPWRASNGDDIIHHIYNVRHDVRNNLTFRQVILDMPMHGGTGTICNAYTHGLTLPGADICEDVSYAGNARIPVSMEHWKTIRSAYWPRICATHGVNDPHSKGDEFELVNHNPNDSSDNGRAHEGDADSSQWNEIWRANTCVVQPGTCIHTESSVAESYKPGGYTGRIYMRILEINKSAATPYIIINFWTPDNIDTRFPYWDNFHEGQATQVVVKFKLDATAFVTLEKGITL